MTKLVERMLWIISSNSENWDYTLENYEESPRFYYHNKGQMNLNTEWSVELYVKLKKIDTQSQQTEQHIKTCEQVVPRNRSPKLDWLPLYSETANDKLQRIKKTEELFTRYH